MDALWRRPLLWRGFCRVGSVCQVLHWSSEARAGGCQTRCQGWAATQSGPQGAWQHPCPKILGRFQLVLGAGAQSDGEQSGLSPFGPHLLSFASPVRWQRLSCLSPAAVGEASPSSCMRPLMPCIATLSGDGSKDRLRRAKCLGAPAQLCLHPPSLQLELGLMPTLAGCSAPISQIFLISLGCLIFPLLSLLSLGGGTSFEEETNGYLCVLQSHSLVAAGCV